MLSAFKTTSRCSIAWIIRVSTDGSSEQPCSLPAHGCPEWPAISCDHHDHRDAVRAFKSLTAWMKAEIQKASHDKCHSSKPTVCLITSCLTSNTDNQMQGLCKAAFSAGLQPHIICCSTATSSTLQMASLDASKQAAQHGCKVSFTPPGVIPTACRVASQAACKRSLGRFWLVASLWLGNYW